MPVPPGLTGRRTAPRGLLPRRGRIFAPRMAQAPSGFPHRVRTARRPVLHQLSRARGRFFSVPASTRQAAALLSATGTLGAGSTGTVPGTVSLRAAGTLRAWASAGPDLDALWQAYLAAQAASHQAHLNWKLTRGSYDEGIFWYQKYYAADQAEIAAYHAWLSARDAALGVSRAPFIPGIA